jgi:hypothetical protein
MNPASRDLARPSRGKPKALFICGSVNQTRQMHQISQALPEVDPFFSIYYCDGLLERMRRVGLTDCSILGWPWRKQCLRYLHRNGLPTDHEGRRHQDEYQLVVTCSDVVVPGNVREKPLVLVQEGMTDPERFWFWARKLLLFVPRWTAGTAWTGASRLYDRFCVASEGYRDLFVRKGADASKIVVTGIPNFDDCARYRQNQFPLHDFVLCCTSDARETMKLDNRKRFILRAVAIAAQAGKPLVFKLHPNEDHERARAEIRRWAPEAEVYIKGSAEEMVANCAVLICQYSTLAFVGLALRKEVHSYFDLEELRRLLPMQGGGAAGRIAEVCRSLLAEAPRRQRAAAAAEVEALGGGWEGAR